MVDTQETIEKVKEFLDKKCSLEEACLVTDVLHLTYMKEFVEFGMDDEEVEDLDEELVDEEKEEEPEEDVPEEEEDDDEDVEDEDKRKEEFEDEDPNTPKPLGLQDLTSKGTKPVIKKPKVGIQNDE